MVIMLLEGFPSAARSGDGTINAYVNALVGLTEESTRRACNNFINGMVDGYDPAFAPSAAQLRIEAQRVQAELQRTRDREASMPRIDNPPPGYRLTPDRRNIIVPPGVPMPDGYSTIGPLRANFGNGEIDMSWMTPEQKRRVIASNGADIPQRESTALVA